MPMPPRALDSMPQIRTSAALAIASATTRLADNPCTSTIPTLAAIRRHHSTRSGRGHPACTCTLEACTIKTHAPREPVSWSTRGRRYARPLLAPAALQLLHDFGHDAFDGRRIAVRRCVAGGACASAGRLVHEAEL